MEINKQEQFKAINKEISKKLRCPKCKRNFEHYGNNNFSYHKEGKKIKSLEYVCPECFEKGEGMFVFYIQRENILGYPCGLGLDKLIRMRNKLSRQISTLKKANLN